jgi:hypothetical protein
MRLVLGHISVIFRVVLADKRVIIRIALAHNRRDCQYNVN